MMSNKNSEQELKDILKKYLKNQTSQVEREAVDLWYESLDFETSIEKRRNSNRRDTLSKDSIIKCIRYAVAAAILMAFTFTWMYRESSHTPVKDTIICTGLTERKQVKLKDGTEIVLNTGTELIVSGDFGHRSRKVILKGEAFFKVAKNPDRPFVIQSGKLFTKVLGTSFNISAYPIRERIKISVLTGRVKISKIEGNDEEVLADNMTENQTFSFFKGTGRVERNTEDAVRITSWRDHKLYIDNASIRDITELLHGFYHVEVKDDSNANEQDRYTILLDGKSMKETLKILSHLTKREFRYIHNRITINKIGADKY